MVENVIASRAFSSDGECIRIVRSGSMFADDQTRETWLGPEITRALDDLYNEKESN